MDAHKNSEKNQFVDAIIRDIFSPAEPPELGDAQLWAYALDILEPVEQDQVMKMIAKSEKAQETLKRIRKSISAAGTATSAKADLLKRAQTRAKKLLADMGQELSSIAAVIVETKDGLITAFRQAGYVFGKPVPVMFGRKAKLGEDYSGAYALQTEEEIKSPQGVKLSIVRVPDRGIDIYVEVTKSPLEGWVKLSRLLAKNGVPKEQDTGIKVRLKDGKARLEDCPAGLLKVITPGAGDRAVTFYLDSSLR